MTYAQGMPARPEHLEVERLVASQSWFEAKKRLVRLLAGDASCPDSYRLLGEVYVGQGEYAKARAAFKKARDLGAGGERLELLERAAAAEVPPELAEGSIRLGESKLELRRPREAVVERERSRVRVANSRLVADLPEGHEEVHVTYRRTPRATPFPDAHAADSGGTTLDESGAPRAWPIILLCAAIAGVFAAILIVILV
jgi:hypothetical protein